MTNEQAIARLRKLRDQAAERVKFHSKLTSRIWKQIFAEEQANVEALEHAIMGLGMLELKPDYYDTPPGI